jgi:hypothetical protein
VDGHTSSSGGHTSEAHGVSQSVTFRGHAGPPVDQRLLAATRVLLLRKGDGEKVLSMMQGLRAASGTNSNTAGGSNTAGTAAGSTGGLAEQLGSWENPIARQHEVGGCLYGVQLGQTGSLDRLTPSLLPTSSFSMV